MSHNDDRRQVMLKLYLQPIDLNQSFYLMSPVTTQRSTVTAMHHNSFIRVQKPHNGISWKRAAAICQFDKRLRCLMFPNTTVMMSIFDRLCFWLYLTTFLHERSKILKHCSHRYILT